VGIIVIIVGIITVPVVIVPVVHCFIAWFIPMIVLWAKMGFHIPVTLPVLLAKRAATERLVSVGGCGKVMTK